LSGRRFGSDQGPIANSTAVAPPACITLVHNDAQIRI